MAGTGLSRAQRLNWFWQAPQPAPSDIRKMLRVRVDSIRLASPSAVSIHGKPLSPASIHRFEVSIRLASPSAVSIHGKPLSPASIHRFEVSIRLASPSAISIQLASYSAQFDSAPFQFALQALQSLQDWQASGKPSGQAPEQLMSKHRPIQHN